MHDMAMQVPEPEFEGQTKTRLGNPEVRKIVDACVAKVGISHAHSHSSCICGSSVCSTSS